MPHAFVVRRELEQPCDELPEKIGFSGVARDARHLFLNFDGFRRLPDLVERLRKKRERVQIPRVGLEADLQLRQRLQAVIRGISKQVLLRRDARVRRVGPVVQQPLDHFQGVVASPEASRAGRPAIANSDTAPSVSLTRDSASARRR